MRGASHPAVERYMKLTERYVELCRELAGAGYQWDPRPGDWMLDTEDGSIGMLTTHIERPGLLRRVNVHLPYGMQIDGLLEQRGCSWRGTGDGGREWLARDGVRLHVCGAGALEEAGDEEALAALLADFRRGGG